MRSIVVAACLTLLVPGCKKKPPETPTPIEAPEPADTTDGTAGVDEPEPEPEPEPVTKPTKAEEFEDESAAVRRKMNRLLSDVDASDVARNRSALESLKALQTEHPTVAEIDLNIGVVEHKLGNVSGAKQAYESALAKDPTAGHGYLYLGALKEQAGDLTGAEAKYREGMTKAPEEVAVRIGLVSTLRKQGRYDEAIREAQEALKVNATSPEIYNDVALAYAAQEDFLLAKFMYRKGLALPDGEEKAYLHANLGWTYYLEGKVPEATFRLKKAVELDREYVPALVYLARVYMEDRNYEDTVELLERAAKREPNNHGVQMNLGIAYRGVERYDDAKAAYERALELDPADPGPHFNLGILLGDYVKDYPASVASFNTYKSAGGTDVAKADEYIAAVQREAKRVEKRKAREAAAKKREGDRAEQKRLAAEEEERQREEAERAEAARLKAEQEAQQAPPEEATVVPAEEEAAPDGEAPVEESPEGAPENPDAPEDVPVDGPPEEEADPTETEGGEE